METRQKLAKLQAILEDMGSLVIAFSGGVDSTFLLAFAAELPKVKVLAVTSLSSTYVERESRAAKTFCKERGIEHQIVVSEELDIPEFCNNPADRCYYCKRELFGRLKHIAYESNYCAVADGSNADDVNDYRPGMRALKELLVLSPLRDAGLTKQEIRDLSKQMGLPTWNKPSVACLASRFPYGNQITKSKLDQVGAAEEVLYQQDFKTIRVRHYGQTARIEVDEAEIGRFLEPKLRTLVTAKLKDLGFVYVTLDLQGYRMGSMNETLDLKKTGVVQHG